MTSILTVIASVTVSTLLATIISTVIAGQAVKATLEQIMQQEEVFMEKIKNTVNEKFENVIKKGR